MTVKANLRIVLLANDVTVAETDDAALWQHTLAAITGEGGTEPDSCTTNFNLHRAHFASQ